MARRRQLLLGLGALGLGSGLFASARHRLSRLGGGIFGRVVRPMPTPLAPAPVPVFDVARPGRLVLRSVRLSETTTMQSFGFASGIGSVYAIQLIGGGLQLPGEAAPVPAAARARAGDLVVNRLARDGTLTGRMYLLGYGHGVQIGVEEHGRTDFIWCEAESRVDGVKGWGTKLARLPFTDLAVVSTDWPEARVFEPLPGADRVFASVDTTHGYVIVWVRRDGHARFMRLPMADLLDGRMEPSEVIASPPISHWFQGFASYGRYLYVYEGVAETTPAEYPMGSAHINVVSWETGDVLERRLITDGLGLEHREAEGLAVRLRDPGDPSTAELCLGFGGGPSKDRRVTIFAKPPRS